MRDLKKSETQEIREIKSAIPLIKTLDPSWNCHENVGWQILRLNGDYRNIVIEFYRDRPFHFNPLFLMDFPPFPRESFQDYERRVKDSVGENIACQRGQFRGFKIDRNDLVPHTIRFPHPLIRPLLPIDKLRPLMIKKGRHPESWSRNLLVYELSRARVKDMEIARWLFGAKSSTEWLPYDRKHPDLVKIAKIKKAMEKFVSEAYPLI